MEQSVWTAIAASCSCRSTRLSTIQISKLYINKHWGRGRRRRRRRKQDTNYCTPPYRLLHGAAASDQHREHLKSLIGNLFNYSTPTTTSAPSATPTIGIYVSKQGQRRCSDTLGSAEKTWCARWVVVPVRNSVFDFFGHLRIRCVKSIRLKDRIPTKVQGSSCSNNSTRSSADKDFRFIVRTHTQCENALCVR